MREELPLRFGTCYTQTDSLASFLPVPDAAQLIFLMFFGIFDYTTIAAVASYRGEVSTSQGDKEIDFSGLFVVVLPVLTLCLD
jgi:uncharacterized membrane protein